MYKKIFIYVFIGCWMLSNAGLAQEMKTTDHSPDLTVMIQDSASIQKNRNQLEKGIANYLQALRQVNEGLVESAMINLIRMKFNYPDLDYSQSVKSLQSLAETGRTQSLRFLAFFTWHYLEDPVAISWLQQGGHEFTLDSGYLLQIVQK